MRLVVDCFKQVKGVGKSIGIYNVALSIIQNLVIEKTRTLDARVKQTEIIVLGNEYNRVDFDIDGVEFVCISDFNPTNKIHCIWWELFAVMNVAKKLGADKILFPRGYCAFSHSIEDIVLIHDLIPFYYDEHFPGFFGKFENEYIMRRLKQSAKSAQKIITISEASKKDVIKYCNVEDNKITVINNACNAVSYDGINELSNSHYICAITSSLPHKNAVGIIESYRMYYEKTEDPFELVIIGIDNVDNYNLNDEIKKKIKCYKFVSKNEELYEIITNAKVFIFLSLVEGFGLPPIEAMYLKTPVICSNISSLPEVVGNAAVMVNPQDYDEVANEIKSLLEDENRQQELIRLGLDNVKRFSWESRAKEYWKAIVE